MNVRTVMDQTNPLLLTVEDRYQVTTPLSLKFQDYLEIRTGDKVLITYAGTCRNIIMDCILKGADISLLEPDRKLYDRLRADLGDKSGLVKRSQSYIMSIERFAERFQDRHANTTTDDGFNFIVICGVPEHAVKDIVRLFRFLKVFGSILAVAPLGLTAGKSPQATKNYDWLYAKNAWVRPLPTAMGGALQQHTAPQFIEVQRTIAAANSEKLN